MRHHTTDPAKRAEHIADHEEMLEEEYRVFRGIFPYYDWPKFWLKVYHQVCKELVSQ